MSRLLLTKKKRLVFNAARYTCDLKAVQGSYKSVCLFLSHIRHSQSTNFFQHILDIRYQFVYWEKTGQ